jgi:acetolactate synthase-1/2/3 large subunit
MTSETEMIKTTDLLVEILIEEGIQFVFGIPGEENLDFTESLRKYQDKIKLILTRHEQAAGFMAATVGRLTGQPGVALSTLGPGATNFTTSAAFAYLGGFPCMFLTGQKPIKESKQSNFQIVDVVEMMKPLTKYTKSVTSGHMLSAMTRRAFSTCTTEKPGPVHLELAEDVATEMTNKRIFPKLVLRRPIAEEKAIVVAVDLLASAKRPVIIVGAAANRQRAITVLRKFVEETGIYWCSTQMGKGVLDERHSGFLGCVLVLVLFGLASRLP